MLTYFIYMFVTCNDRMFDPIIISYGKGQLPAFFGNPDAPMDVVSKQTFNYFHVL